MPGHISFVIQQSQPGPLLPVSSGKCTGLKHSSRLDEALLCRLAAGGFQSCPSVWSCPRGLPDVQIDLHLHSTTEC